MICAVIAKTSIKGAVEAVKKVQFAEVRLDLCSFSRKELALLLSKDCNFVVTCRPGTMSDKERLALLAWALEKGASYIDIELEAKTGYRKELLKQARKNLAEVIISYHNFNETPDSPKLKRIIADCFTKGADIAKIACQVNGPSDASRLLALHDGGKRMIVAGMGPLSPVVRVAAPFLGSIFSYAAISKGRESAPGQLTVPEMQAIFSKLGA